MKPKRLALLQITVFILQLISTEAIFNPWISKGRHLKSMFPAKPMKTPELIRSHGYPVETHTMLTSDGYIINMHRIPYSSRFPHLKQKSKRVIFIPHCLFCSSITWVMLGEKKGLAYMLSDSGYDVWMMNNRGNTYTNHSIYSPKSRKYWDFSFDEIGMFDAPQSIDYVLEKTGVEQVDLLSFSMGTTVSFVMFCKLPEYNKKVRKYVSVAPVAFVAQATAPIIAITPLENLIQRVTRDIQIYGLPPAGWGVNELLAGSCHREDSFSRHICEKLLFTFVGSSTKDISKSSIGSYLLSIPDTTSVKVVAHFAQMYNSDQFQEFDYGVRGNIKHYNSATPPAYNLSQITVPIALFSSDDDLLSNRRYVQKLRDRLPSVVRHYRITAPKFSHMHFIWGKKADKILYVHIINFLLS